ncbi:hypothetical protein BUALT_Bualt08G0116600 [Buddleja alternifolia]|uniref:Transposase-associated domain-containing protein n=1 Tax=Buddleja alternifolia TaxID=168488 RepID=A0AAV6XGG5_9LAMI|nr:hypothetical protein BUALT_Bualt08G0116600 [Buddleja alternifolia]
MDKSWINEPNTFSEAFIKGVESFLKFAEENAMGPDNLIYCPCRSCNNSRFKTLEDVRFDLHMNGFSHNYPDWIFHGEKVHIFSDSENDISDPINNDVLQPGLNDDLDEMLEEMGEMKQSNTVFHGVTESFSNLLRDAKRELCLGCKKSLLSVIVKLLHIKVMGKWSNKSFNMLLEFLKEILLEGETLPSSLYGAKKILNEMGLGYKEIEACKNDCALFYKENDKKDNCPICDESRWKINDAKGNRVPHKILRYFPLKPSQLQAPNCIYSVEEHIAYRIQKLVDKGISPREVCPREDLSMAKWQAACDFIEDEKFQDKMIAKQSQPVNEDEEPPSEEAILESTLGRRSGYIKGMGHGVEVVRGRQSSSYMVANTELKEKLEEQKKTLEVQRIALDEQNKEMEACKEQHSQEIDALKAQMAKIEKLLHTIIG